MRVPACYLYFRRYPAYDIVHILALMFHPKLFTPMVRFIGLRQGRLVIGVASPSLPVIRASLPHAGQMTREALLLLLIFFS